MSSLHFTVVGAGAIGGTVGAQLVRSGHRVLFVDRETAHVEAINAHGLTVEGRETFTIQASAVTPDHLARALGGRPLAATLLCVKAMHTEAALEPLLPLLDSNSYVVSLQNGLNERVIASHIGVERTIGAFVNFGADYLEPGRIMFGGGGALYLGELDSRLSERVRRLGEIFQSSVLENTRVTDNIWGYLWGKLAYGSMLFATALADATMADVLEHPTVRPALANLAGEVLAVARNESIRCEGFDGFEPAPFALGEDRNWDAVTKSLDRLVEFNRRSLKQKSGVWRDLAVRRRKTEVNQQPGLIVEIGRLHGISTPLNARLVELIHDIEDGRRSMRWANLEELAVLNARAYPAPTELPVR